MTRDMYLKYSLELQIKLSKFYTKNTGSSQVFSVTYGRFNLGLPHIFLELMCILQHQSLCFWFLGNISVLALSDVKTNSAPSLTLAWAALHLALNCVHALRLREQLDTVYAALGELESRQHFCRLPIDCRFGCGSVDGKHFR